MFILLLLNIFCLLLGFTFLIKKFLEIEENIEELYNLYYKNNYNFDFKKKGDLKNA